MTYKKDYKYEQEQNNKQPKLSRIEQLHRQNYTSKTCDMGICNLPAFQPHPQDPSKLCCYHCFEKAWGEVGNEEYDRDKFKAKLDTIKDPMTKKWLLGLVKRSRATKTGQGVI